MIRQCFRHDYYPHTSKNGFVCMNCGQYAVEVGGKKVEVLTLPDYKGAGAFCPIEHSRMTSGEFRRLYEGDPVPAGEEQ